MWIIQTYFPYQDSVCIGSSSKPYAQSITTLIFLRQTTCLCTLLWNTCNLFLSVDTTKSGGWVQHSGGTYYCHSPDEVLGLQTCCFYYNSNWSCTVAFSGNTEQRVQEKLLLQTVNNLQINPQCVIYDSLTLPGKVAKTTGNTWQANLCHLTLKCC